MESSIISISADMVISVRRELVYPNYFPAWVIQFYFVAWDTVMIAVLLPEKLQVAVTSSCLPPWQYFVIISKSSSGLGIIFSVLI